MEKFILLGVEKIVDGKPVGENLQLKKIPKDSEKSLEDAKVSDIGEAAWVYVFSGVYQKRNGKLFKDEKASCKEGSSELDLSGMHKTRENR